MTTLAAHLRRNALRYVMLVMSATTALGLVLWALLGTEPGCAVRGGHWGSTVSTCYTPRCFEQGDCGEWAAPRARCDRVAPGDPRAAVYFQLGNPLPGDPQVVRWTADKVSGDTIIARFDGDRLLSLACPATP